jgi:signal transduction histidine kinase/putative methionine-R-sulfoxide reductase with GAF domain
MSNFERFIPRLNKFLQGVALAYQIAAVIAVAITLYNSIRWLQLPFLGAIFEQTMAYNGAEPTGSSEGWDLYNQGITLGEQLVTVTGKDIHNARDLQNALRPFSPGENVEVVTRTRENERKTYLVTLHSFPTADRETYLIFPTIISIIFLIASGWIFGLRRTESAGRAFSIFASSLAIVTGTLFDLYSYHLFPYLWTLGLSLIGGALVDLALAFPQEAKLVISRPYLRWIGYAIGLLLAANTFLYLYDFEQPTAYFFPWKLLYLFSALCGLFFMAVMLYHTFRARSPVVKSQARFIMGGAILGLGAPMLWLLINPLVAFMFGAPAGPSFTPLLFLPLVIFPASLGYTILRFRILRTDDWVRQGLFYALMAIFVSGGFAMLVAGLSLIFKDAFSLNDPVVLGFVIFVVALLLNPLRNQARTLVDTTFFRGQRAYTQSQQEFTHKLSGEVNQLGISHALRDTVMGTLGPNRAHLFIYDSLTDQYSATPGPDNRPTSDIRFAATSPLVNYFRQEHLPLYLDGVNFPAALRPEETRLAILDAHLFVRLPGKERPLGWLALGQRVSGQVYTPQELTFLDSLCEQAAIAIERAQTVSDMERRVQEMNTLTRVSQGVNITLSFEDVLELIYAQTLQIVPASDFHITLHNKATDYYYYGFCVENKELREELENEPLPANTGLAQDVIRKGRPLITQDYMHECQTRNVLPDSEGVYAWMGVPLNAGAETIGALSVGSRDSLINYTRGQLELLQNIADQTAGAIVKSRLLEESQRRARQLTTLNEITRQLTSTLESEPLLKNILENAVSILNCEAGSLFLVDEQTDELIFKVTVGPPSSANLMGQRLPPGSGIVGRAVHTRKPVIDNDAQKSGSRHAATDQQTGFVSRTLLAVPLQVKDRVLGVIEIINRKDGLPFGDDDQNLLTAFAGQAAVAIENARLYTLTDQELAARVEELSVMQRIDRELNASLEMDRALRITLEWAMRQSRANAGLIGMIEERDLRIMAHQGYGEHLSGYAETPMPLDLPSLRQAVENGQPQRQILDPLLGGSLLPDAREQIVIPIRREAQVIGLLMLESLVPAVEDISFLNRLGDHAAIAIANAQLYAAVQAANLAKSDFVSFVAHELKNPMTSIKGYTELLAGGKVGAITDMQANFLNTIRSNVERMSTLVSDLNDNSKIEAGRLRLDFKAVDASEVVEEAVRSTRRQIEDKKQTIEVKIAEKLPLVWADRTRVSQVLINLVSNAHKYTPEGGDVIVGAEATHNQWDPEGAARVVHLWVRDNGIGIGVEDQQKIFQKFFRSDDQKAREAPGTGLGLNITKSLVEMQGGRIWFESEYRKGATFHFTIPVAEE